MKTRVTTAGDLVILRRAPHDIDGFQECADYIKQGDARFCNLETTLGREGEFCGGAFCGGSNHRVDPEALDDVRAYGFNMLSFANNHTFDYSYGGLLNTLKLVEDAEFVNAGVGRNLDEASAPRYLETKNGRVAIIACVSTMVNDSAMAGQQSRRVPGRPGVNGLRVDESIVVTSQQMKMLREIAEQSHVNAEEDILRAEGYSLPVKEGQFKMKNLTFVEGEQPAFVTHVNKMDMARIEKAIYEAKYNADVVLVSVHSHENAGTSKETPSQFLQEFSHSCIDAGAHAVIGNGPHLLRPLEIYKGYPIFYSLGDFNLYNESLTVSPEDLYTKYGLSSDDTMTDLYKARSNNFTRGLLNDSRMHESVMVNFVVEEGKVTDLELMPIELGFDSPHRWQQGNPKPCFTKGILERYEKISSGFGTKIDIDSEGLGHVRLN